MTDEKNIPGEFKVVDRRSFTPDGAKRPDEPQEKATEPSARPSRIVTPSSPPKAARPSPLDEPEEEFPEEGSNFETLVSYLSTTAMFQLGLIPGPGGERIPLDMENAQRTIDLLEVLQDKTKGNLTSQESRLLDNVLYELRMTFLELQKRQARKA